MCSLISHLSFLNISNTSSELRDEPRAWLTCCIKAKCIFNAFNVVPFLIPNCSVVGEWAALETEIINILCKPGLMDL